MNILEKIKGQRQDTKNKTVQTKENIDWSVKNQPLILKKLL